VNDTRCVPPPPSALKKRRASDPSPPVDGSTSTKHSKASDPGGLLPNWKRNIPTLSLIAHKHPIEFVDKGEDLIEGEFNKTEGLEALKAVHASKSSTMGEKTEAVCVVIISKWIYLLSI